MYQYKKITGIIFLVIFYLFGASQSISKKYNIVIIMGDDLDSRQLSCYGGKNIRTPNIDSIVLNKSGKVRRAKLYYLRERSGKSARIKEKRF